MEDQDIIRLYRNRDETAISATMEKYGSLCRAVARNIVSCDADAEECVNDAYLALWNEIPPCTPTSLRAFLLRIVRNISLDRFDFSTARKRNVGEALPLDELEELIPDRAPEEGAVSAAVNAFLAGESETARRIFVRRYFYCDAVREIATLFSMSESRVKSILFRERKKLKAYLTKEGVYFD